MSNIIFITIVTLLACLITASWYIRFRFDKTPKEDKWFDNIIYILCPLLTTCIGVLFALWIDRNEAEIRQREATIKTLKICHIDANNSLELIRRCEEITKDKTAKERIEITRAILSSDGMPYPKVIQQLLFNENSLANCESNYLEAILRELNKLNQLNASINENLSNADFAYYLSSYTMALEEIRGMTFNEIKFIKGEISKKDHDREIDVVMDGDVRMKKLAAQRVEYKKLYE